MLLRTCQAIISSCRRMVCTYASLATFNGRLETTSYDLLEPSHQVNPPSNNTLYPRTLYLLLSSTSSKSRSTMLPYLVIHKPRHGRAAHHEPQTKAPTTTLVTIHPSLPTYTTRDLHEKKHPPSPSRQLTFSRFPEKKKKRAPHQKTCSAITTTHTQLWKRRKALCPRKLQTD